jgi:hypothetical protein
VLEEGRIAHPESGTPQGGVISPILANIFLHEVLDVWFEHEVKPRLRGKALMVRYADDVALAFSDEADARKVLAVLPKRFGKYGLTLHPEKTRLTPFHRPPKDDEPRGRGETSFDLLGFTHCWGKSQKGYWVIRQRTAAGRFWRAVKSINEWCKEHRHMPVPKQQQALAQKLKGHYGYYGVTGNSRALGRFSHWVTGLWRKWLDRRSQHRHMSWERFKRLLERYPLPNPVSVHSMYRRVANP